MLTRLGLIALVAAAGAAEKKDATKDATPTPTPKETGQNTPKETTKETPKEGVPTSPASTEAPAKKEMSLVDKVAKFNGNFVDIAHTTANGGTAGQRVVKIEGTTITKIMGLDDAKGPAFTVTKLYTAGSNKKSPKKTEKSFVIEEKDGKITATVDFTEKKLDAKGQFVGKEFPGTWPLQFVVTLAEENGRPVMLFPDGNKWVYIGAYDEKFVTEKLAVPAQFDKLKVSDPVPSMAEDTEKGCGWVFWIIVALVAVGLLAICFFCCCTGPEEDEL